MLDSALVDVVVGLVLLFFILALASSSIVEAVAGIWKIRAKRLEEGIRALVEDPELVYNTSVFAALSRSAGANQNKVRKPSYVSARAFADAVVESIARIKGTVGTADQLVSNLPENLRVRLDFITNEVGDDVVKIKARLEDWFDEAMDRVAGAYKRWSQVLLFVVALTLTIATNASATHVAASLWRQPSSRDAVVQAAKHVTSGGNAAKPEDLRGIASTVGDLKESQLPLGWKDWHSPAGYVGTGLGWFLTAFLVLLGAPFWYGLLTKLVSLRSSGNPPPKAADDPASATATQTERVRQNPAQAQVAFAPLGDALSASAFGPFASAS